MLPHRHRRTAAWILAATLAGSGCFDFHAEGPEDPSPVPVPELVSVVVRYTQPVECLNTSTPCDDNVTFFGSWMRPGTEFFLARDPRTHEWSGVAVGVPVNYPPYGDAYLVRVYDPHLRDTLTEGFTAERLVVGGERLTNIDRGGGKNEAGRVYVDSNGHGHNAF